MSDDAPTDSEPAHTAAAREAQAKLRDLLERGAAGELVDPEEFDQVMKLLDRLPFVIATELLDPPPGAP
jgi:hypothetical protein